MLNSLDYFSLLIPFIILVIIFSTLVAAIYKRLSFSIIWFLIAMIFAVIAQFTQTVLLPKDIYTWAVPICLLFFLSVIFTAHAVYLRLNITTHWTRILSILCTAELILAYFCFIQPSLEARLIIVATTSVLICLNRPKQLLRCSPFNRLDRILKYSFYSMIFVIFFRAIILVIFFNQQQWLESYAYIWATTQFFVLFFVILLIVIFINISIQETIYHLKEEILFDPLTHLYNRRGLNQTLKQQLSKRTYTQHPHALLLCDIDHFKKINDQYGHPIGDQILQQLSHRLIRTLDHDNVIARIGGEEFVIIFFNNDQQTAIAQANKISQIISQHPFLIEGHKINVTISIGLDFFYFLDEYESCLKKADEYLYQAKKLGRNILKHTLIDLH